jgi:hypothetical protein
LDRAEGGASGLNQELAETSRELGRVERQADDSADAVLRVGTRGVSAFSNLRGSIIGVAAGLAAIQGIQVLGRGFAAAIQDASNLEESLSKTNVVFGDFADTIEQVAADAPRALGLSTQAALEATATFGNLFVALGLSQSAAADLSPDIVQLGADLASFNNITVDEALTSLRSGLVGEVEPLRRLGVAINAAVVEQKALELGLVDASGAVTEAGKVQARYALILEQTATAQGDYARTADGIANTQRTLQAEFQNISTALGEALLPAYQALLELAPALADSFESLVPVIGSLATSAADAAPSMQSFADALQALGAVPVAVGTLQGTFQGVFDVLVGGARALTDTEAGLNQIETGIGRIQDAALAFDLSQLRNNLVDTLQAGVDPATALGNALVELSNLDLNTGELQAEAAAFAQIAGLDPSRLADLSLFLQQAGEQAGLSTDEVLALRTALSGLAGAEFARRTPGGGEGDEARRRQQVAEATLNEAAALEVLGEAADTAGISIFDLLQSEDELEPSLTAASDALSASTVEYLRQVGAIDQLGQAVETLPGTMEAAAAALRDEQGEIVEDFDTFFTNLQDQLAQREQFESNLAILRALGLDNLADVFDDAGLEAASALADAISNPQSATEAERQLSGQYVGVGESLVDDLRSGIEAAGGEVTTALIDNILQAAILADSPETRAALAQLAEALRLEIPSSIAPVDVFSPEAVRVRNDNAAQGGGRTDLQGETTVIINNPTTQDLNTDAARAAQTISSVTRFRTGVQ